MTKKENVKTVFFNESAIHLSENNDIEIKNSIFIRSRSDMHRYLDRYFKNDTAEDTLLVGSNLDELMDDFVSWFKYVETAGGIVKSEGEAFLLIRRFDVWDLPKGRLKKGEKPEEGAKREVTEETAVEDLELVKSLPSTYHIYLLDNKYILKKTNWYMMETDFEGNLQPQIEEDITDVKWMKREDALQALKNSYRSIREVLLPLI
jgi:ADP-ribose pyrophosphatase YjhB (NUDIX family)